MLWVTALIMDFDHLTEEQTVHIFEDLDGVAYAIYTSFSHQQQGEDDNCFRAVIPLSRRVSPDEYADLWSRADELLGGKADGQAKDQSRLWFLPTCRPDASDSFILYGDGKVVDVEAMLVPRPEPALAATTAQQTVSAEASEKILGHTEGGISEGSRNDALTRLGGVLRQRGVGENVIRVALLTHNQERCSPPLPRDEVERISASISKYEPEHPLLRPPLTDAGNAERLKLFAEDELAFDADAQKWMQWGQGRWATALSSDVLQVAVRAIRAFKGRAEGTKDQAVRKARLEHARRSEQVHRLKAACELAQGVMKVVPPTSTVSQWLLNCTNGVVDLRTGELRPHDSKLYLTRQVQVAFDLDAGCPRWEQFMVDITDGDQGLNDYLQKAAGYSLTGSTQEQVVHILLGAGQNGKTVFVEVLRTLLGDYASQTPAATLLRGGEHRIRNDIARLKGKRFVTAAEFPRDAPLGAATLKLMSGGDTLTARHLYKEFIEFTPEFKVWMVLNHLPLVRSDDAAVWRRLRIIHFRRQFKGKDCDPRLMEKLRAELPGILAWLVRGAIRWHQEGLVPTASMKRDQEIRRARMDPVGAFIESEVLMEEGHRTRSAELGTRSAEWAEGLGLPPLSMRALRERLRSMGALPGRINVVRYWVNVRLKERGDTGDASLKKKPSRASPPALSSEGEPSVSHAAEKSPQGVTSVTSGEKQGGTVPLSSGENSG